MKARAFQIIAAATLLLIGCNTANSQGIEAATKTQKETTDITNQTKRNMMTKTIITR